MKEYLLKDFLPSWHFDPATVRQLMVLRFFGIPIDPIPTKGRAGSMVGRLFSDPANKHLWTAYVYTTGDDEGSTSELRPHDHATLAQVVIPEDWRPRPRSTIGSEKRETLETVVGDLLAEGSPFDDPLPEIGISGKCFAFTGRFEFGSRKACQGAVLDRGGLISDGVTSATDVLVVGSDANSSWSHGGYGNKIQSAMIRRMQHGKPAVIPESFWKSLLET